MLSKSKSKADHPPTAIDEDGDEDAAAPRTAATPKQNGEGSRMRHSIEVTQPLPVVRPDGLLSVSGLPGSPWPQLGESGSPSGGSSKGGKLKLKHNRSRSAESESKKEGRFRKRFPEHANEPVLFEAMCALVKQRGLLIQGIMYLTGAHVFFFSVIRSTRVVIDVRHIESLKKQRTMGLISNAIAIATHDSRYLFTSFLSRDAAFKVLSRVVTEVPGNEDAVSASAGSQASSASESEDEMLTLGSHQAYPPLAPPCRHHTVATSNTSDVLFCYYGCYATALPSFWTACFSDSAANDWSSSAFSRRYTVHQLGAWLPRDCCLTRELQLSDGLVTMQEQQSAKLMADSKIVVAATAVLTGMGRDPVSVQSVWDVRVLHGRVRVYLRVYRPLSDLDPSSPIDFLADYYSRWFEYLREAQVDDQDASLSHTDQDDADAVRSSCRTDDQRKKDNNNNNNNNDDDEDEDEDEDDDDVDEQKKSAKKAVSIADSAPAQAANSAPQVRPASSLPRQLLVPLLVLFAIAVALVFVLSSQLSHTREQIAHSLGALQSIDRSAAN